jgi:hypothetical protein
MPVDPDLRFTIAYALWDNARLLPKPGRRATGWPASIEDYQGIAGAIAEHLALNGYEIRPREPTPPPRAHGYRR